MSHPYGLPSSAGSNRPIISDVETGPDGRWFTVTFRGGQLLPSHRNANPIEIIALEGAGVVTAPSCGCHGLVAGESVHLAAHELHDVAGGPDGLVIRVRLILPRVEVR